MVEHEVHVDMQVLEEATFKKEGNQALVLVQRDYELLLGESCRALEEAHDLTKMVPSNYGEYEFKIFIGNTFKEVMLVHNYLLPTSFSATSIQDENWAKGFFFMVPHEEYVTCIYQF